VLHEEEEEETEEELAAPAEIQSESAAVAVHGDASVSSGVTTRCSPSDQDSHEMDTNTDTVPAAVVASKPTELSSPEKETATIPIPQGGEDSASIGEPTEKDESSETRMPMRSKREAARSANAALTVNTIHQSPKSSGSRTPRRNNGSSGESAAKKRAKLTGGSSSGRNAKKSRATPKSSPPAAAAAATTTITTEQSNCEAAEQEAHRTTPSPSNVIEDEIPLEETKVQSQDGQVYYVEYIRKVKFVVSYRGHTVLLDRPIWSITNKCTCEYSQRGQGWLAFIKWKGYSEDYNSWERVTAIPALVVERFKRKHPNGEFAKEPFPAAAATAIDPSMGNKETTDSRSALQVGA